MCGREVDGFDGGAAQSTGPAVPLGILGLKGCESAGKRSYRILHHVHAGDSLYTHRLARQDSADKAIAKVGAASIQNAGSISGSFDQLNGCLGSTF